MTGRFAALRASRQATDPAAIARLSGLRQMGDSLSFFPALRSLWLVLAHMDRHTFEILELDQLLELLARHVQTPMGRSSALGLRPRTQSTAIDRALDLTAECVRFLDSGERFGLSGIEDPEPSLARLQIQGSILEPNRILELEHLVAIGVSLRDLFRDPKERAEFPGLSGITGGVPDLGRMLAEIKGKVLPGGEIDDDASRELRDLRHQIQVSRARIHRSLEGILHQQTRAVQDEIITFRNGRFVIPLRTDTRFQVPGVVHGLSSSGQTTFVEPLSVIELNNDLVRLREQEEIEINRILLAITETLREHAEEILMVIAALTELDVGQAKARLALEFDCVRPRLAPDGELRVEGARHILLDHALRRAGSGAVPISFAMDGSHPVLVISGPNAGGKTVVLKTVGLVALMAQMGLHVPARVAVLPVFHQVWADIGDQQSIAANLSTFTAHMRNIAAMAGTVAPPALLLIDEVGTGTDPEEGAALAVAIVDYFRRSGATTLVTTHYNPLKMWASNVEGVLNASVEFDERTLRPTYRLIVGVAGASSGLDIARRLNVPDAILDHASSLTHPDHTLAGNYLKRLKFLVDEQEASRAALEEERAASAIEYARLEERFSLREATRQKEFESFLKHALDEFRHQSEQLLETIKDRIAAEKMRKLSLAQAAQLRRSAVETKTRLETEIGLVARPKAESGGMGIESCTPPPDPDGEPVAGGHVWVKPLGQAGIVESIRGDTITVSVGSLRYRARRDELQILPSSPQSSVSRTPPKPMHDLELDQTHIPELNVVGMRADEAVQRVDKYLDESFLAGARSIRIIHGHGKGILRRAISELLTGHPHVENFHLAPPGQGGNGVTIVDLIT